MATQVSERQARRVAEEARETEWKLPSFGRELFLGDLRLDLIHPQPRLDEAAASRGAAFLRKLSQFLEAEVDPLQIERDARIPDEVLDGLKALGALGMKVPEEYGGLGLSQVYYNRALMVAGGCHSALSTLLSAHQSIGVAQPLLIAGSEEQKREWLPKVAQDHISAFFLTEPDVGSDPARLATVATPTADGSGYVINGRKLWATNGAIADVVVVMARVPEGDGHRGGISAFIVPCDDEGVVVEHRNQFMGLRGIENSVTRFNDVFVPNEQRDRRGGTRPEDRSRRRSTPAGSRCRRSASAPPSARPRSRASSRTSACSGASRVGKHDAVAQKIAFIAATAFGLEAMLDVASRLADDKTQRHPHRGGASRSSTARRWAGRSSTSSSRSAAAAATRPPSRSSARGEKPVPVEQALRDMRINRIFEGSTEIMHLLIAREAVDQHLKVAGDILERGRRPCRTRRSRRSTPAASTPSGCPSSSSARASRRRPTTSSASSPTTCASPSATRASSRARRSTG